MKSRFRTCTLNAFVFLAILAAVSLQAQQPTGQWDFNSGNLSATVGTALQYIDGAAGPTQQGTAFNTTTGFGIPDIGGAPAQVMRFPANTNASMGYSMPAPTTPNGGGGQVNEWTIIMDVLFTGASDRKLRGLLTADRLADPDTELFVNANNQLGVGTFYGTVASNTWHRIAMVVQTPTNKIYFYIDGVQVGFRDAGGAVNAIDGRWALTAAGTAELFNDDDGGAASGYVNSIQLRDVALSKAQISALGGPTAAGIPATLPPIAPFVESWIPSTAFARGNTDVGVILERGSSVISNFVLRLDGQTLTPTITTNGGLYTIRSTGPGFALLSDHTVVISFNDSASGPKSFTNTFRVPILYEDFDLLVLGPSVDPALGTGGEPNFATNVWTTNAPPGWSIDNSKMPPQTDPPSGRPEWEGWAFADVIWWSTMVDTQLREAFTKARGAAAIADPDEWDDFGNPDGTRGYFHSFLSTPAISLQGVGPNTAYLRFDSSWRPEGFDDAGPDGLQTNNQTGTIKVSYNGGAAVQILKWDSQTGSPTFHPDAVNETVTLQLNNPAGATNVVLTFGMTDAGNDWWWAVDGVIVDAGASPPLINRHPQSQLASAGANVSFSVAAAGSEPFGYQWLFNSNVIAGATSSNYTRLNVQASDAGGYAVIVSNAGGAATSSVARLEVFAGPITSNLVVHLKFDGNYSDSSGRTNNATSVGSTSFASGRIGQALQFSSARDGTSFNYATLGTPADLNFSTDVDFSIAMWVNFTNWTADPSFIANKDWDSGSNPGYVLATAGNGGFQWNLAGTPAGANGDRKDFDGVGGTLSDGNWHHIAVTFDRDGFANAYVDGALAAGSVNPTPIATPPNNADTPAGKATNIGQDGVGDYTDGNNVGITNGRADDVGIWRRVLTPQEVAAIYNAGQSGNDLSTAVIGGTQPQITSIVRAANNVTINWSGSPGLKLQKTASLTSPITWQDVAGTDGSSTATEAIGTGNAFYRLIKP